MRPSLRKRRSSCSGTQVSLVSVTSVRWRPLRRSASISSSVCWSRDWRWKVRRCGSPVHACEVDVLFLAQVHPLRRGVGRRRHAQLHQHVAIAGGGVALLDDFGAIGVDLVTLLHGHRRFVDAREGDGRVIRRPPVAGAAAHLFLGDEFGDAVADAAAFARRYRRSCRRDFDHLTRLWSRMKLT